MFSLMLENENGNIVDINDGERYVVLSASGLTPPSASLFTSKSPNRKGSKYNGSTLDERTVVIELKILGDVEVNRNALYEWIDTEQYCKIRYKNGVKNAYCEGYVQDCPIDLFTDNEVVSVAIICPNPYWKDLASISVDISQLLRQFTFPFAIQHNSTVTVKSKNLYFDASGKEYYKEDATVQMNKGVPFSTLRENNIATVLNAGAETGARFIVKCNGDIENLTIYDAKDTTRRLSLKTTLRQGQVVIIDTEASPKTVKRGNPDGTTDNLMRYLGANPTWFTLKKGINQFAYTADAGVINAEISISFSNKYLGI